MNTSLKLFTDPRLLSQVSHRQVALLIDRLVQLFPGKYVLPATRPDNDPFVEVLAEKLAAPDNDLPAPFLTALKEVEALASPKNVQNLNIPQNVDPQDPESTPLYHAILAWLAKHPAPPVKPPPPAPPTDTASSLPLRDRKLPKKSSAPRKGAPSHPENPAQLTTGSAPPVGTPSPASPIPQHRVSPENAVLLSPNGDHAVPASVGMPSSVSPINQNLPTAETAVPAASDNAYDALDSPGAPAPIEPEPEPDELPARSARPGLKLRLSVLFYEIDPRVRHEFFARFEKELREAFPDLPEISYDNQHFDNAVYGLLKRPAFLPEPMRNALLAIQELAAPANRQLLRALATHRSIYCEHQATPEHVAVGYWLKFPFQPGELESLRASVPSHLLSPPKPRSNGEATDDEGGLPWPETV